jgi:hypothetical protein
MEHVAGKFLFGAIRGWLHVSELGRFWLLYKIMGFIITFSYMYVMYFGHIHPLPSSQIVPLLFSCL